MAATPTIDPILARLRRALDATYGDRIERVVLFGSRARGDAGVESDYDVAVFLRHMADRWHEMHRLAEIETDILYMIPESRFMRCRIAMGFGANVRRLCMKFGATASICEARNRAIVGESA